jgi:3-oxoacyl-[acyl-carrier-protein] synthase I
LRRVVVTGLGIISCLGNEIDRVAAALRDARSGIAFVEEYAQLGFRSHIAGIPQIAELPPVERKLRRFMGEGAVYAFHAMNSAIANAALTDASVAHPCSGLIVGSGVGSTVNHIEAVDVLRTKGAAKVPPYMVPRVMGNTVSACLATAFNIKGVSYSIASACATSAHAIGNGMELIASGKQDVMFVGGAEEVCWPNTLLFDAMGALSGGYNATPTRASRPYDVARDGFVIAGGAGILVLEALEHALQRGARIYAEVVGYGACSDGLDMVAPSQDGAARAMQLALQEIGPVDYINTHGTATPVGDMVEVAAMRTVFGNAMPRFSSTKALTGHAIAAAGAHEAIYSLLMMRDRFIAGSANIDTPEPALDGLPLVRTSTPAQINTVMSNSFGFGGTNASLIFRRLETE